MLICITITVLNKTNFFYDCDFTILESYQTCYSYQTCFLGEQMSNHLPIRLEHKDIHISKSLVVNKYFILIPSQIFIPKILSFSLELARKNTHDNSSNSAKNTFYGCRTSNIIHPFKKRHRLNRIFFLMWPRETDDTKSRKPLSENHSNFIQRK